MIERIMVLEDVPSQLKVVEPYIPREVTYFSIQNPAQPLSADMVLSRNKILPVLIIVDLNVYDDKNIALLSEIHVSKPHIPMVIMLPFGDREIKQKLRARGLNDILIKPFEAEDLAQCLSIRLTMQRMSKLIARLERQNTGQVSFDDVVGHSAALKKAVAAAQQLSTQKIVLIEGENGTGKSLFARAMHGNAKQGQEFTFYDVEKSVSQALDMHLSLPLPQFAGDKGGTVYLREISFLTLPMQQQFLRWLRETSSICANLSIICSTSINLDLLSQNKIFDRELYWMLKGNTLSLPRLNERREDISLLAQHFLSQHTAHNHKYIDRFSDDAYRTLANADWPGNLTQLSNLVYRCSLMCNQDIIDAGTLRLVQQLEPVHYARQAQLVAPDTPTIVDAEGKIKKLKYIEDEAIQYALSHFDGSMSKAAASLGIGRSTLYRRITSKQFQSLRATQTMRPTMQMSAVDLS